MKTLMLALALIGFGFGSAAADQWGPGPVIQPDPPANPPTWIVPKDSSPSPSGGAGTYGT